MPLQSFWTQSITRIRPGTKTERGSTVYDWSDTNELVIDGCSVQPTSTSLTQDGRVQGIQDGLVVYAPEGIDVQAGDRICFGGNVYTINGEPLSWPAAGRMQHIQLNLVRWQG